MAAKTKIAEKKAVQNIPSNSVLKIGNKTFTFTQEEKISYILLALLLFLVVFIRVNFLNIPYERDEGGYSYYGKLLLEGKIPYKDFYEQKLPGIFYFYAFMVSIFGSTVKGMHLGFIYLNVASILFIYFAVKRLFSPGAAIVSATTFALVSLTPNLSGFTIQGEHGVAFFTSMGIYLYAVATQTKKWYWYFIFGLSLGTAFMIKTTGLFMMFWGGVILITDFIFTKERNFKEFFKNLFLYGAGASSIIIILLLIIYMKGAFNDMIFWVYDIPKYYVNRIPLEEGMKYFDYSKDAIVQNYKFLWIHGCLAVLLCITKSVNFKTKCFVISLAVLSFMTIVPGYYFYGHYWIQTIPGLSVLSGITFFYILIILKNQFKLTSPNVTYVYLAIFTVFTLFHLSKLKNYYFSPNYESILRTVYGNNPFPETMAIADYINSIAKPEDQLAVFGSEPELFIYTNKKSPTRHVFFSTIVASIPEHKKFQREFASDIEKAKPKYFVFYRHSVSLLVQANVDQYVFEWANKFINANYKLIGLVDMVDGQRSTYIFDESAQKYQPKSQNFIMIFERKS
ncbi:MAG TPA: glycosyltransferase family 39 protein [Bacteroidia bacterium]|jgi:hypothetical protein|nr:glycosyltransferase family 39 protein [Bacteroidia bacterium]